MTVLNKCEASPLVYISILCDYLTVIKRSDCEVHTWFIAGFHCSLVTQITWFYPRSKMSVRVAVTE
jgi:hypothetical protein